MTQSPNNQEPIKLNENLELTTQQLIDGAIGICSVLDGIQNASEEEVLFIQHIKAMSDRLKSMQAELNRKDEVLRSVKRFIKTSQNEYKTTVQLFALTAINKELGKGEG